MLISTVLQPDLDAALTDFAADRVESDSRLASSARV